MDIQKEREAFETWLFSTEKFKFRNKNFLFMLDEYGSYEDKPVLEHWETWQAAKTQAVPEGFVLVKKELPEQIAEKMAIDRIDKPRHENDPVWSEIAEQSYKDQVKSKKWEFWRDYKAMIEAQEPAND